MRNRLAGIAILASIAGCAIADGSVAPDRPAPAIVEIDTVQAAALARTPLQGSSHMQVLDAGMPQAGYREDFVSGDGQLAVGVAFHETVTLRLSDWPVDEFMYFLSGRVEITDSSGHARVYGPGDAIVMPRGFSGTWRQLEPLSKVAITFRSTATLPAERP